MQALNDPYFNGWNVEEILTTRAATTSCAQQVGSSNHPPVADAGPDFTVPVDTPFTLKAIATPDLDSDLLFYCWEEYDPLNVGLPHVRPTTLFRSLPPAVSATRTCPRFSDLLVAPPSNMFESLPTSARDITFRLTVRDNHPGAGSVAFDDMTVHVAGAPFRVVYPNSATALSKNASITVTWDVGGVALSAVDILLYVNGFEYLTLAASTPNDGTQSVTLPNVELGRCRILVRAVGNIFFDISDQDFTIGSQSGVGEPTRTSHAIELSASPNPMVGGAQLSILVRGLATRTKSVSESRMQVDILDVSGRLIRTLFDGPSDSFPGQSTWDGHDNLGHDAVGGMYFVRVKLDGAELSTKKVIRVR